MRRLKPGRRPFSPDSRTTIAPTLGAGCRIKGIPEFIDIVLPKTEARTMFFGYDQIDRQELRGCANARAEGASRSRRFRRQRPTKFFLAWGVGATD
jgi:hypothetical protein